MRFLLRALLVTVIAVYAWSGDRYFGYAGNAMVAAFLVTLLVSVSFWKRLDAAPANNPPRWRIFRLVIPWVWAAACAAGAAVLIWKQLDSLGDGGAAVAIACGIIVLGFSLGVAWSQGKGLF